MKPVEFNGPERTASAFFYFASRAVPNKIKKIHHFEEIERTIQQVSFFRTVRVIQTNDTETYAQIRTRTNPAPS